MNMKKTNTLKGVNSMPAGTRIVTYICLAWALIVSLLPIGWLVLSSLKKDPMAETWLSASGIHLSGWLYFHI